MATRPIHIMIIGTHPADVFDQAGGTLAHHIEQGDKVTALTVTTGAYSHELQRIDKKRRLRAKMDTKESIDASREKKLKEVRKACAILGITDLRTLNKADDLTVLTQELVLEIGEEIRKVQPDMLITHHPHEGGGYGFHATTGQATIHAADYAASLGRSKTKPRQIQSIYFMSPYLVHGIRGLGNPGTGHPEIYVDITDVIEKKIEALNCIQSQYYDGLYSLKRAETEDGRHGELARVAYAEQFQRYYPWVCYTLPISDFELDMTTQTWQKVLGRFSYMATLDIPLPEGYKPQDHRFNKDLYA